MVNRPEIITDRLVMKALNREELMFLHSGNLSGFRRARGWPSAHLVEALPHFINDLQDDPTLLGWGVWGIIHRNSRELIGDVGLKGAPDENGVVEIGYSMSIPYRGKGYTIEAVNALIEWAFRDERVTTVIAECDDSNRISKRVLESVGMDFTNKSGKATYWKLNRKK